MFKRFIYVDYENRSELEFYALAILECTRVLYAWND